MEVPSGSEDLTWMGLLKGGPFVRREEEGPGEGAGDGPLELAALVGEAGRVGGLLWLYALDHC